MSYKRHLVTGGTGFIGSAIVKRLLRDGHKVRVLDNNSRGLERRLADCKSDVELIVGDVREAEIVANAIRGVDVVHHLAFINGTENFYRMPDLVLDVGIKGMMNVIGGCLKHGVGSLLLASSSEVYQTPSHIPTDETAALVIPDPSNPRYSYAGGKIASELIAINFGRKFFERVVIYRPHNIYGPDMGQEHVIPQFAIRLRQLCARQPEGVLRFPIQGTGDETRAFCYIDDLIEGVMIVLERGEHLGIYHIGTMEEVTIKDLAQRVAACFERRVAILPNELASGSTLRRCPDIRKITKLGYVPKIPLNDGLQIATRWYSDEFSFTNHNDKDIDHGNPSGARGNRVERNN